jgi:hypothetical protein
MYHAKYLSYSSFGFLQEDFLRLKKKNRLPWQPEFFTEFNSLNDFGRALCKEHPCKVGQVV